MKLSKDELFEVFSQQNFSWQTLRRFCLGFALLFLGLFCMKEAFPVVIFEQAKIVERTEHSVILNIKAIKIKDCGYIDSSAMGFARTDFGKWFPVRFEFLEDTTPGDSREPSITRQDFGLFFWKDDDDALRGPITDLAVSVQHDCHDGYELDSKNRTIITKDSNIIFTVLGPWKLDDLELYKHYNPVKTQEVSFTPAGE